MKHPFTASAALLLALAVCLASCSLRKPQTVRAAPPAPTPTASPAPPAPPAPLSIPQTDVHLPPSQPVTPEAAATAEPPEEPAAAPAPPRPAKPKPTVSRGPSETPAPATTTAVGPPTPPEHPPIEEVTPAAEQKRFQDEAAARKREVHQIVDPIDRRRLNRQQKSMLDRIQSFLKQADDAEGRGEMRQASELAQRALVLARQLKP